MHHVFHRAHGSLVVEQQGVGHPVPQHLHGKVNHFFGESLVHPQGEFRLQFTEPQSRLHDCHGNAVRVLRIPAPEAAHHDPAVPAVRLLHQAVEGKQQFHRFLFRHLSAVNILRVQVAQVYVHPAEIPSARHRGIEPHQLQRVAEARRRAGFQPCQAVQHRLHLRRIPSLRRQLPELFLIHTQEFRQQVGQSGERLQEIRLFAGKGSVRQPGIHFRLQARQAQAYQLVIVQLGEHQPVQSEDYAGVP